MEGPKEARAENGEKFLSTSEKKISEQRHVHTERFLDTVWFWPDPDRTGPNLFGQIGSGCGSMIFSRLDTGSKPLCHKDFHLFHNYFQDAFQIFWQSLVIFFPFHNFFGKLLCLGTGTGYWKRIRTQRNLKTGSGSERLHTEEQNKRKSHFHISDFHLLRILFLQFQLNSKTNAIERQKMLLKHDETYISHNTECMHTSIGLLWKESQTDKICKYYGVPLTKRCVVFTGDNCIII